MTQCGNQSIARWLCTLPLNHAGEHIATSYPETDAAALVGDVFERWPAAGELFFLAISGDGGPTRLLIEGLDALRRELSEQFFGPDGPQTDDQRAEEAERWAHVLDREDCWSHCHGEPFAYEETGEDYGIAIYPLEPVKGKRV